MASPIIAALRRRDDLKESVQHTVQELAHLASIYGVARVSLRYLAWRCNCCKQTIINHLKKLIALKIIRKQVLWIKGNLCETNTYTFRISWEKQPAQMCHSKNSGQILPPQEREKKSSATEEGKEGSLRQKLRNQYTAIREGYVRPGGQGWEDVQQKIAELEAIIGPVDGGAPHAEQIVPAAESPRVRDVSRRVSVINRDYVYPLSR
jgi:hypothetical protein